MDIAQTLAINLALVIAGMTLLWGLSLAKRNVSIVDIFWGAGFVLLAWTTVLVSGQPNPWGWVILTLVSLWGLRLTGYLAWRNWGRGEDYRYAEMRERHGDRFRWISLLTVFGLQAVLIWLVALPVQLGLAQPVDWQWWRWLGIGIWMGGMVFESVGDFQLARFKSDPANRGMVMDRGLWRYTRHPNYFGDFLVWWGHYLVAVELGSWWWSIVGPTVMTVLLLRVSGVRLLESKLRTRVAGYQAYAQRTNAFFPGPPRSRGPTG